jgi:hypothetical protein
MTITRAEFLRLLPVAVGHAPWRVAGDRIESAGPPPAWRIRLEERPGRAFGPVALPVLAVTIELAGATEAQRAAFRARFLLGFQRAGG